VAHPRAKSAVVVGSLLLDLLDRLLSNYYWAWNDEALDIFHALPNFGGNPYEAVRRLSLANRERLELEGLAERAEHAVASMDAYLAGAATERRVAYFSAEFGIHECLPLYSGGLGVLAGDHLKSASDQNLPLVGVGLVYRRGYFHQRIDADGMQHEEYPVMAPLENGFRLANDLTGRPARITVPLDDRECHVRVWETGVGRVPLYLLDTDLDENVADHRFITSHLYGGDREMRIRQEIVLGIGGLRALRALGYDRLETFHLNEGHAAFLVLESIAECRRPDEPLERSRARAAGRVVFTTHTPVPAGHDVFPPDLVCRYLGPYAHRKLRCSDQELLALGGARVDGPSFSMTELALNVARAANGVSARHGEVSRAMFPGRPIDSVTNGVHHLTWTAPPIRRMYDRFLPGWRDDPAKLTDSQLLPEDELRQAHQRNKDRMVERLNELQPERLDAGLLTIGFARRFATYKRAGLLFHDSERLAKIAGGRVQLLIAGKAHPQDETGKRLIQEVIRMGAASPLTAVFIADYDLALGKLLVAGVDVWLNNPRRPMEASGTSGMKASLNGVPNLSVLDGWWIEGYDGTNGWAIGPDIAPPDSPEDEDARDAESLYMLLAERVIPEFYDHPADWSQRMKRAIASSSRFTTHRMVGEYARRLYRL
jgi:starch phosphorylase